MRVLRILDPTGQHIPDLGLCVDQRLQLYDIIDQELFIEEITMNGEDKGSNAIRACTSIHTDWNISTTLNSNVSKPASVVDLHSSGQSQVTVILGEPIAVFSLTRRTESAASTAN